MKELFKETLKAAKQYEADKKRYYHELDIAEEKGSLYSDEETWYRITLESCNYLQGLLKAIHLMGLSEAYNEYKLQH